MVYIKRILIERSNSGNAGATMQRIATALLSFLLFAGFYIKLSTQQPIATITQLPIIHEPSRNSSVGVEEHGEQDHDAVPPLQCADHNGTDVENCTIPLGRSSFHPTRPQGQGALGDGGAKTSLLSFGPFGGVAANFTVALGLLVALVAGTTYLIRRKRLLNSHKVDKWRQMTLAPMKAKHFARSSKKLGFMDVESQQPSSSSSDDEFGKLHSTVDLRHTLVNSGGIANNINYPTQRQNDVGGVELVPVDSNWAGLQSNSSTATSFNGNGMILQRRLSSRMQYNPSVSSPILIRNVSDIQMNDVVGQSPGDAIDQETKQIISPDEDGSEPMDWQSLPGPVEVINPFFLNSGDAERDAATSGVTAPAQGSKDFRWEGAWEIRPEGMTFSLSFFFGYQDHTVDNFDFYNLNADIEKCTHPDGRPVVLGNGAFGQVLKCLHSGVTPVAVKYVKTDGALTPAQYQEIRHEAGVLCSLRHPNIVGFIGAYLPRPDVDQSLMTPMLVMEYMEGGDLRSALSMGPDAGLLWRHGGGVYAACDILRALHALHHRGIIHFDVKSPNVLLGQGGRPAKLSDVGLAAQLSSSKYVHDQGLRGTFAWVAPEILLGVPKCSEKVDMYSFGVVLWEIVTGEIPQRGRLREVKTPEECPLEVKKLIDACLSVDPISRPSAKDAYQTLSSFEPCKPRQ